MKYKNSSYAIGQDNIQKWGFDVHHTVFIISLLLSITFLITVLMMESHIAKEMLDSIKWKIISKFDSLFILSGNIFLLFCLALILLPQGKIRLGGQNARPNYSRISWFSMLFSAGMGIGLMFWSVAEPIMVIANAPEAEHLALGITIFHWRLHPWAAYGVVALSLAYFTYNKGLPLLIRSAFYPILGVRTWGIIGHCIDILAVLATLFGLATSLGLGAQQVASGLHHIFGLKNTLEMQISIIIAITSITIFSIIKGIDAGVKLFSNINIFIAIIFLIFVAIFNIAIVSHTIPSALLSYIKNIIPLSNPFEYENKSFQTSTVFYWAWWFSWSPFVGMFIARISRGRTIREFLLAILIIPTCVSLIWISTFGGIAIFQVVHHLGILGREELSNISLAIFQMFDILPFSSILSIIAVILVLIFFITSFDSASLVIDSITAGGKLDTPVLQRIFWVLIEAGIATTLIWIGGSGSIQALQDGVISTALPFTFIMLFMIVNLVIALHTKTSLTIKGINLQWKY